MSDSEFEDDFNDSNSDDGGPYMLYDSDASVGGTPIYSVYQGRDVCMSLFTGGRAAHKIDFKNEMVPIGVLSLNNVSCIVSIWYMFTKYSSDSPIDPFPNALVLMIHGYAAYSEYICRWSANSIGSGGQVTRDRTTITMGTSYHNYPHFRMKYPLPLYCITKIQFDIQSSRESMTADIGICRMGDKRVEYGFSGEIGRVIAPKHQDNNEWKPKIAINKVVIEFDFIDVDHKTMTLYIKKKRKMKKCTPVNQEYSILIDGDGNEWYPCGCIWKKSVTITTQNISNVTFSAICLQSE